MNLRSNCTTHESTRRLIEAASHVASLAADFQTTCVAIGAIVEDVIRLPDGTLSTEYLSTLACLSSVRPRRLGACHEAYLVATVAGPNLVVRLNGMSVSYDMYRQLSRVLKAALSMDWAREKILSAAGEIGHGLPAYMLGALIDGMIPSCPHTVLTSNVPWSYRPLSELARQVANTVAADGAMAVS